jgi:hypothetical protein
VPAISNMQATVAIQMRIGMTDPFALEVFWIQTSARRNWFRASSSAEGGSYDAAASKGDSFRFPDAFGTKYEKASYYI